MARSLIQRWHALTYGRPGRRFEDRYEAARKARLSGGWSHHLGRVLRLVIAVLAFGVGLVLAVVPGPAILFFLLSGSLLAAESRGVARLLDRAEVRLRAVWQWSGKIWAKLPVWGRACLVVLVVAAGAGTTYVSYRLMSH
jgi:hypothetical protein